MFKYTNAFTNRSGDSLPGYFAKLFDSDGNQVDLFADDGGTPISTVSGVANAALSDENGMFRWYVANGTYDIRFYDSNDTFVGPPELGVPMIDASGVYTDLSADDGATRVGTPTGTVQDDIDARPTAAVLAAPTGGEMVGFSQAGTGALARDITLKGQELLSSADFANIQDALTENMGKNLTLIGDTVVSATIGLYPGQGITGQADGSITTVTTDHHLITVGVAGASVRDVSLAGVEGSTVENNSAVVFGNSSAVRGKVSNVSASGMSGSPFLATGGASDIVFEGLYTHDLTGSYQNQTDVALQGDTYRCSVRFNLLTADTYSGTGSLQGGFEHDILFNVITGKRAYGILDYETTPAQTMMLILGNRVSDISGSVPSGQGGAGIYAAATGLQRVALNDIHHTNQDTTTYGLGPAGIGFNGLFAPSLSMGNIIRECKWHGRIVVSTTHVTSSVGEVLYENERDQFCLKASGNALISGLSVTALTAAGLATRGVALNVSDAGPYFGVVLSGFRVRGSLYGIDGNVTSYCVINGGVINECVGIPLRYTSATALAISGMVLDSASGAFESLQLNDITNSTVTNLVLRTPVADAIVITGTCTNLVIDKSVVIHGHVNPMNLINNQGTGCVVEMYGTAVPSANNHQPGDRVINRVPTVGQPKAWICTVAGAPGTWVSEGNL